MSQERIEGCCERPKDSCQNLNMRNAEHRRGARTDARNSPLRKNNLNLAQPEFKPFSKVCNIAPAPLQNGLPPLPPLLSPKRRHHASTTKCPASPWPQLPLHPLSTPKWRHCPSTSCLPWPPHMPFSNQVHLFARCVHPDPSLSPLPMHPTTSLITATIMHTNLLD